MSCQRSGVQHLERGLGPCRDRQLDGTLNMQVQLKAEDLGAPATRDTTFDVSREELYLWSMFGRYR